jgi:surface antigen
MREFFRIVHAVETRCPVGVACLITGALLSACSLSVPVPGAGLDDTATGTIKHVGSPFSAEMDAEDWRRAKSAMDTALDPQGNGARVAWENPLSGAKGAFVPLAQPYPNDDGICRAFTADVEIKGRSPQVLRSAACRRNGGEWIVGRIASVKPSKEAHGGENLAERDNDTHLN